LIGISKGQNWFHQYGNTKQDVFTSIAIIPDSGYILLGHSNTLGNGKNDLWVVRINKNLDFLWQRYFGGPENDFGKEIIFHKDRFIIIGEKDINNSKDIWILKLKLNGDQVWSKTYGDNYDDFAHSIDNIEPDGYLITGEKGTNNKNQQGLIMLIDFDGEVIWEKIFGGNGNDGFYHGINTLDGGYAVVGYTNSFRKSGLKAPKSTLFNKLKRIFKPPKPSQELWLARLSTKGDKIWEKTYGGLGSEIGKSVSENTDSSLFIIGNTNSFENNKGDTWIIKTNKNGYEIWNKTIGGKGEEYLKSIIFFNKKEMLLSMQSNSSNKFYKTKNKNYYTKQVLLNRNGRILWENNISENIENDVNDLFMDSEGKILNIGYKLLNKEKVYKKVSSKWNGFSEKSINHTIKEAWIFQTDLKGNKIQEHLYSGDRSEIVSKSIIDNKSNIFILGNSNAFNINQNDIILLNFNGLGNLINASTFIEKGSQIGKSLHKTSNGEIIIIGEKYSQKTFGVDLLVKSINKDDQINWETNFGSLGNDIGIDAIGTVDGTIIVGKTNSYANGGDDGWLIKINESGLEEWSKTYGELGFDEFTSIDSTTDGNYILTGTKSSGGRGNDLWLVKIDKNGNEIWEKTYGGHRNERGLKTIEVPTGGFITLGEYKNNAKGKGDDIIIIRTTKIGDEIWSKIIGGDGDQIPSNICAMQNNTGYIIVGTNNDTNQLGISRILLMRINTLGNVIWERSFGESYHSEGLSVIDDGNGLLITGNIDLDANGNSDIFILKTDYEGNILKN